MSSHFIKRSRGSRGDIHVSIGFDEITGAIGIYLFSTANGKNTVAKPVDLEFTPVKDGDEIAPTLKLNRIYAEPLLAAIAEALEDGGIHTDNAVRSDAALDATKYHLEDLRQLLKLRK